MYISDFVKWVGPFDKTTHCSVRPQVWQKLSEYNKLHVFKTQKMQMTCKPKLNSLICKIFKFTSETSQSL